LTEALKVSKRPAAMAALLQLIARAPGPGPALAELDP
jgi:hypothetical protein